MIFSWPGMTDAERERRRQNLLDREKVRDERATKGLRLVPAAKRLRGIEIIYGGDDA